MPAHYGVGIASPAATNTPALPALPLPGAKPREIRAALHPEYRDEFDRDYQAALAQAGRTLDLEAIHDTLRVVLETAPWSGRPYYRDNPQGAVRASS